MMQVFLKDLHTISRRTPTCCQGICDALFGNLTMDFLKPFPHLTLATDFIMDSYLKLFPSYPLYEIYHRFSSSHFPLQI